VRLVAGVSPIARLCHKYEALVGLRSARARGEPIPEKAVFRALADEFPGALYELDRAPMDELDARASALRATLTGAPEAPWMRPMAAYHALYRAALYVKGRTAKGEAPSAEAAAALAAAAGRHASIDVDLAFVRAVARPDGGRIGPIVLAEVAARHGGDEGALRGILFPTRRNFAATARDPAEDGDPTR
jgi:hypothetical protein